VLFGLVAEATGTLCGELPQSAVELADDDAMEPQRAWERELARMRAEAEGAGVATRATVEAWVERARERTLRHLREEIDAAELLARGSESSTVVPPSNDDVRRVEELERAVTGQTSAPPASPSAANTPSANVTLRLRVYASTASDYRHWEAIYLRHPGAELRNTTFLRFACELFIVKLIEAW
jgi:hypothetical protein